MRATGKSCAARYLNWCREWSLIGVLLLIAGMAHAQFTITGKVIDEKSKAPLAFVNIIINQDNRTGTTSDINGKFTYASSIPVTSVTCSYVGYEKITVPVDKNANDKPLVIAMHESPIELGEVVVKAG